MKKTIDPLDIRFLEKVSKMDYDHSLRITKIIKVFPNLSKYNFNEELLYKSAILHDVGKARLRIIHEHPQFSFEYCLKNKVDDVVANVVLLHHQFQYTPYPCLKLENFSQEEILHAFFLSCIDNLDARSIRSGLKMDKLKLWEMMGDKYQYEPVKGMVDDLFTYENLVGNIPYLR